MFSWSSDMALCRPSKLSPPPTAYLAKTLFTRRNTLRMRSNRSRILVGIL